MLDISHLTVAIGEKIILVDVSLHIAAGNVLVLFGPNGSGKSTLIRAVMGLAGYRVMGGTVSFKGEGIDALPTGDRVRRGMGMMYQQPPAVRGVKLRQIACFLTRDEKRIEELAAKLSLTPLLERDVNTGFSGGELKRSELFQLLLQNPDLLLLDEPESGVDIENIEIMGRALNAFLKQEGKSALIITHTGYILEYIEAQRGCVMLSGRTWCLGDPAKLFRDIRTFGYEKCVYCHERKT